MASFFPVQQVSEQLLRSAQPDFEDLLRLKGMGLRGLVNLREEAIESEFFARQCGLSYLHIPVVDWNLPSDQQVRQFLEFVFDKEHHPTLVHCAAGVGRTGTFVACYRIAQGMDAREALRISNSESPLSGVAMNELQQNFVRQFRL